MKIVLSQIEIKEILLDAVTEKTKRVLGDGCIDKVEFSCIDDDEIAPIEYPIQCSVDFD
jgi:hypothetical protein